MNHHCTHCGSYLSEYWWETQIPQSQWTEQQKAASAQLQRATEMHRKVMDSRLRASDQQPDLHYINKTARGEA